MLTDAHSRPLRNLRISVTDRCNLRCSYCMPEADYVWLPREHLLDFEEIGRLVDVFIGLGVDKVRLTGGEPLLRRDLHNLVAALRARSGIRDLALTTNGTLLAAQIDALKDAGLQRVTVSLDSLRSDRFAQLSGRDELSAALKGLEAAVAAGLQSVKLNTVVMRGANDDELVDLIGFGREHGVEVRFIEYMDVGGATDWGTSKVVSRADMLRSLTDHYGPIESLPADGSAPAQRFRLADGTVFGIISSTTQPFCGGCDRSRLTADGHWYTCLYARRGLDLRRLVRSGAADSTIAGILSTAWSQRVDRGAEDRLRKQERGPLAARSELQADPHLEMHTRGG